MIVNKDMKPESDSDDIVSDDMTFPKATIDVRLTKLQAEVTEFVTSIILKHESEFYILVSKIFPDKINKILGSTCASIIQMITETTEKFYNMLYMNVQKFIINTESHHKNIMVDYFLSFSKLCDYGPHILLDKLMRLTLEIHLDINRECLITDNADIYSKKILEQTNIGLLSHNLLHILSKGPNDDNEFVVVPDDNKPFNIVIDKNIQA